MAESVIGPQEPLAVPAVFLYRFDHGRLFRTDKGGFFRLAHPIAQAGVVVRYAHVHAGDENALGNAGVVVGDGLEALAGLGGEAVQVQTVVPVRTADQGQLVGALVFGNIVEGTLQMHHHGLSLRGIVVKIDHLAENAHVAGFLDVGIHGVDQPQGIVIEAAANVHVAALGQGLILMVGAAVRELSGGHVQNAAPGAFGDQMDEAQQILTAIAEAHAAADAAFKIAGGAAHIEGDHALVLVPQVHLTVQLFVRAVHVEVVEQTGPVLLQRGQLFIKLRVGLELPQQRVRRFLVDDAGRHKLFVHRVFAIAQHENQAQGLAGLQFAADAVAGDGRPAVSVAVGGRVIAHYLRIAEAVVQAQEGFPAGVIAVHRRVDGIDGVMIAALPVLGLVIDGGAAVFKLHFRQRVVALEVGGVVLRVPQAELDEAVQGNLFRFGGLVGQGQPGDLGGISPGYHDRLASL